ncbi:FAD-binding oxidoreductase [soil metagenome]
MDLLAWHQEKIKKISDELKKIHTLPEKKPIRFSHCSTNSTRVQDKSDSNLIDISSLNEILTIDIEKQVAIVEPNVPMDQLVNECLKYNLIPKVVMEFPGITCGGGVNGAALEASSFKYGQFNDTCDEYECILADGTILIANTQENSDLYYGISGSYGSLALITRLTISLIPANQFVELTFYPTITEKIADELQKIIHKESIDYLEGIVFDPINAVTIVGKLSDKKDLPVVTFSRSIDEWFYLYAEKNAKKEKSTVLVPIKDYLFRYNRGAFWTGKNSFQLYHMPFNRFTRFLLNPFMNTRTMYKALHETNLAQNYFIQDFYIPTFRTNEFIQYSIKNLDIFPIWLCPIKGTKTHQKLSPHYLNEEMLIDVGLWGEPNSIKNIEEINTDFEKYVETIQGRKMLYAASFYSEDDFWKIYDREWYKKLRKKYHSEESFPTIWEKTHVKKRYPINKFAVFKIIKEVMLNIIKKL